MIDEDALKQIETLHRMKKDGIITEDDFEKSKTAILHGGGRRKMVATSSLTAQPAADDGLAWMLLPLKRYADFEGRSSRKEFWMFLLFTNLVSAALFIFGAVVSPTLGLALFGLGILAVLVPLIAVQVRRLHDQGKVGWFALLNLIPYIGPIIVLAFMLIEGAAGDNEYGPDPKAAGDAIEGKFAG